jgi:hypothetical protein
MDKPKTLTPPPHHRTLNSNKNGRRDRRIPTALSCICSVGVKRTSQTSYDGAEWLAGLAVTNLGFVGRTVDSDVDLRRADFWQAICVYGGSALGCDLPSDPKFRRERAHEAGECKV